MKRLILLLTLIAVTGCGTNAPAKPSALPAIYVIDTFWEQRRDSVPVLPDDFGQRPAGAAEEYAQAPSAVDVSTYVHEIDVNNRSQVGSCVAVRQGYVTAKHVLQNSSGQNLRLYRLSVSGTPIAASVQYPCSYADVAVVLSAGVSGFATVASDPPEVGADVLLYGMRTEQVQKGKISQVGDHEFVVMVDGSSPGVLVGDSGGGVFTASGELLGVISAHAGSDANGTADHRKVYVAPVVCAKSVLDEVAQADPPPVTARYPRLLLFTDPPRCAPCRTQEQYLEELKVWDKKGRWSQGPEDSNVIQILDDEDDLAEEYGIEGIPAWIRVSRSGNSKPEYGPKTKEQIAEFLNQ